MNGFVRFLSRSLKSSCLHSQHSMIRTGIFLYGFMNYHCLKKITVLSKKIHYFLLCFSRRRARRVFKSPDPLEQLRRKELQQGEFGNGGLFG